MPAPAEMTNPVEKGAIHLFNGTGLLQHSIKQLPC